MILEPDRRKKIVSVKPIVEKKVFHKLITNDKVRTYLDINYPEILERFENIIFENEKKQIPVQV